MKFLNQALLIALAILLAAPTADAEPQAYSPSQWREDLRQLEAAIVDGHPNPFDRGDEVRFKALVEDLDKEIDKLSDKEIVVRMAEIVGTIKDGHTRLSFPREHPEIGLEFGHSGTPLANKPELSFRQLPVAFEQFEDGIFIVGASDQFRAFIGSKLLDIEGVNSQDVMDEVQRITFAENEQLKKLMGADRLSMPEALAALGIAKNSDRVSLTLQKPEGQEFRLSLEPLSKGEVQWFTAFSEQDVPLRNQNPDELLWYRYMPTENIVFAQIDQITDTEIKLAQFVTEIVAEAERYDAKLVIDLRSNFGGSGDLNRTLKLALVQSDELNRYGKTFALIGRRTFSAAQSLVNFLDEYTRVIFVGEPTGARPDHYGDSKKTRLENSGLTLRVSSLHWSSFNSNDDRPSTGPDAYTPWTSKMYFAGRDPAMEQIISFNEDFNSLLKSAYRANDREKIARYLTDAILAPDTFGNDLSEIHLKISQEFLSEGKIELAGLVLQYGLFLHPKNTKLQAAFKALKPD